MKKAKTAVKGIKPTKAPKVAHTSSSKIGMGDFYGTGVRQKVGRVREIMGMDASDSKKTNKAPKSLA